MKKLNFIIVLIFLFCLFGCNKEINPHEKLYEYAKANNYLGDYDEWINNINNKDIEINIFLDDIYYSKDDKHFKLVNVYEFINNNEDNIDFLYDNDLLWKDKESNDWSILASYKDFSMYYTVTFSDGVASQKVKENEKVIKPIDPEKVGYNFLGWYLNDILYDFNLEVKSDLYLEARFEKSETPVSIKIIGDEELFWGYTTNLKIEVLPSEASKEVIWQSSDPSIATVDQNGLVTGLKYGSVRIKAVSKYDANVFDTFKIKITEEVVKEDFNLGGYEIEIYALKNFIDKINPFSLEYSYSDKEDKQKDFKKIESLYNCKIVFKALNENYTTFNGVGNWIINNFNNNEVKGDLVLVNSSITKRLAQSNAIVDVNAMYDIYGNKNMLTAIKHASSYKNAFYSVNNNFIDTKIGFNDGLIYSYNWLESLQAKDPAQIYNEGDWTYSEFTKWVLEVQSKLDEGYYVLSGQPIYYFSGLSNSSGVKINDPYRIDIKLDDQKSINAINIMNNLYSKGCFDITPNSTIEGSFFDGLAIMAPSYLWHLTQGDYFKNNIFSDETSFGFVPFPRDDSVSFKDHRIGTSSIKYLALLDGKEYPSSVSKKAIYYITYNAFFSSAEISNQDSIIKKEYLKNYIDSKESINAISNILGYQIMYEPLYEEKDDEFLDSLNESFRKIVMGSISFDEEMDKYINDEVIYG